MKLIPIVSMIITVVIASGFSQITLEACRSKAKAQYPLVRQLDIIRQSKRYTIANAHKGYLPQISISGRVSYQSAVTQIPKLTPMMPSVTIDKDQYQAVAELSQVVWDGGAIAAQEKNARAASDAELKKNEVDLYALNDRVQQLFFGILLLGEQLKQNEILREELETNLHRVTAYMTNGIANQADVDAIAVEMLGTQQHRIELFALKKAYREMLSILTGEEIPDTAVFIKPPGIVPGGHPTIHRPELEMFTAQKKLFESQRAAVRAALRPKLSLFLQGGYGRPSLNMLDNDFSPYYIGGARLSWNLSGLYTRSNTMKKITLEMDNVETLREVFLFNTECQSRQYTADIDKYQQLIDSDDQIIALRSGIKKAAEAKVENGTMTVSDLLREINAENLARQAKALHEVQLLLSIYTLQFTMSYQELL